VHKPESRPASSRHCRVLFDLTSPAPTPLAHCCALEFAPSGCNRAGSMSSRHTPSPLSRFIDGSELFIAPPLINHVQPFVLPSTTTAAADLCETSQRELPLSVLPDYLRGCLSSRFHQLCISTHRNAVSRLSPEYTKCKASIALKPDLEVQPVGYISALLYVLVVSSRLFSY
jgi:hypothetical protein